MNTNTNQKKWLWPVVIVVLAAVVLLAVALNYAVRAERNARYVGMMNVVAEKLSKTFRGVEMNAENVFDEVAKHMESPQAVIQALGSKTSLNPDVIGYFAAFVPNYFPQPTSSATSRHSCPTISRRRAGGSNPTCTRATRRSSC